MCFGCLHKFMQTAQQKFNMQIPLNLLPKIASVQRSDVSKMSSHILFFCKHSAKGVCQKEFSKVLCCSLGVFERSDHPLSIYALYLAS